MLEINTDCWGSEVTWTIEDINSNVLASGGPYSDVTGGEYITENFCLAVDCYDFIINDSYGDGMFGSQWGSCTVDGNYTITDVLSGTILASTLAANADYGNQEINNFCLSQPAICGMNVVSSVTDPQCIGIDNGSINVAVSGGAPGYTYSWANSLGNSSSLSGLSEGSFTLTISDSLLCDTIINYDLNYLTTLSLSNSSYDITCNGANDGSVSVTPSGSSGYLFDWGSGFNNISSLSGLSAGIYTVNVMDTNGCMISTSFNIVEPPASQASYNYTMNDLMVYFTNTSSLGANSWDFGDGSTSSSSNPWHTYSTNGIYNACLNLTTSCGVLTYCEDITVFDSSSIDVLEISNDLIKVYPNPSKGIYNINLISKSDISLNVFDLSGRLVLSDKLKNTNNIELDISDKLSGTYILKMVIDDLHYQKRIILARE